MQTSYLLIHIIELRTLIQMSFAKRGGACKQERILCFKRAGNIYCNNFIKHISETLSLSLFLNFWDIFMKLNLFLSYLIAILI